MGKKHRASLFIVSAFAAVVCGCGDSNPATFPVSGVVTLDDKAVDGATVTFVADGGGNSAATQTDAQGKYQLATFKEGDGAMPGTYKVIVAKYQRGEEESPYGAPPEAPAVEQTAEAISEAYSKGYKGPPQGRSKAPKQWNDVPDKYGDPTKSGLTFKVEAKPNTFDIKLSSK